MRQSVVIIGSGLGGLSAGVILAKNGCNVTVLEQNSRIGGCLQCFSRNGVKFETGMHFIGSADKGQILYKLLHYLGIYDSLTLSRLDENCYNTVSIMGERFRFANGRENFMEQMATRFPLQRRNLERYLDIVESIAEASSLHSLKDKTGNAINTEYQLRSINDVIECTVSDPLLQKVLVGDLPLYAAERDKTPFSVHAFVMDFYNRSSFRIAGGSDIVATSLAGVLEACGGKIICGKKAARICCSQGLATGVECSDGDFFPAGQIISAIHPMRTMELLEECSQMRPIFRKRINSMPQTIGAFSLYLQFREGSVPYMNHNFFSYHTESPWGCEEYTENQWPKGYLYMHGCQTPGQRFAQSGMVISYMRADELARWQHTSTGRRGTEYADFISSRAERLLELLERDFPLLRGNIVRYHTSSPLTYRDYTGTQDGSIYGVAKDITLGSAGRVPHKTRIPNLYLAGQNVNSHGILGVIVGSVVTCSEFLGSDYLYRKISEADK